MGTQASLKMKVAVLVVFALCATAFADDLFKPVDQEVFLQEEATTEPTQNQFTGFGGLYGGLGGLYNPYMMGMYNPYMMGMYNPYMMGMFPPFFNNNAAAGSAAKASFLEEESTAEPAEPAQFYNPFLMGMYGAYGLGAPATGAAGATGAATATNPALFNPFFNPFFNPYMMMYYPFLFGGA
eukprot:c8502_g1_i1.p1 GENE.c8502_g1_i1~~c8502_g1_i1.p1  ORF type:complete len:182 (-),score=43.55 c8502_g1_i1:60-605(-)